MRVRRNCPPWESLLEELRLPRDVRSRWTVPTTLLPKKSGLGRDRRGTMLCTVWFSDVRWGRGCVFWERAAYCKRKVYLVRWEVRLGLLDWEVQVVTDIDGGIDTCLFTLNVLLMEGLCLLM